MAKTKNKTGLVLQGGGATGAFTSGAILRLLEDPRINIKAISGASSGAMNGLCLAAGLNSTDNRIQAATFLTELWGKIALPMPAMKKYLDTPLLPAAYRWPNLPVFENFRQSSRMQQTGFNAFNAMNFGIISAVVKPSSTLMQQKKIRAQASLLTTLFRNISCALNMQ